MRSLSTILRLVAQVLVALFAVDSIVSHFQPQYSTLYSHDRITDIYSNNIFGHDTQSIPEPDKVSNPTSEAHQRLHEQLSTHNKPETAYRVTSYTSQDTLIKHWTLERPSAQDQEPPNQSLLFLTITRDDDSWGRNPTERPRTIYSFLDFVTNTTLSPNEVSLAILTSSQKAFDRYKAILTPPQQNARTQIPDSTYYDYPFQRITLVLHQAETRAPIPDESGNTGKGPQWSASGSRDSRHSVAQHERRAVLAKLRNYLQSASLSYESHILWLDSDVYRFSSSAMVSTMMSRMTTTDEREIGLLTARCRMGDNGKYEEWLKDHPGFVIPEEKEDEPEPEERGKEGSKYEAVAWRLKSNGHYDLNAWRGRRTSPNNIEQEKLWKDLTSWEPHPAEIEGGTTFLDEAIYRTGNDDVVRLDSVGGTILMLRADLVRMGLNFATGYTVGMTFEHGEGFDGIESEGICLLSRSMSRDGQSLCYTMGGDWSVWHTVF